MGVAGLVPLTAAEILAEINKVATCTTNILTDARVLALDSLAPAAVVFNWDLIDHLYQAIVGTWAIVTGNTHWHGAYLHDDATSAIGDSINLGACHIPVDGDYTAYLIGQRNTNRGIVSVMLNDTDEGTMDMYGTAVTNMVFTTSLGTLTKGIKAVTLEITAKHASSSDNRIWIQSFGILKT